MRWQIFLLRKRDVHHTTQEQIHICSWIEFGGEKNSSVMILVCLKITNEWLGFKNTFCTLYFWLYVTVLNRHRGRHINPGWSLCLGRININIIQKISYLRKNLCSRGQHFLRMTNTLLVSSQITVKRKKRPNISCILNRKSQIRPAAASVAKDKPSVFWLVENWAIFLKLVKLLESIPLIMSTLRQQKKNLWQRSVSWNLVRGNLVE